MLKKRKYDLIFIIFAAGILALLYKTGYSRIIENYALVFVLFAYFIGKGIGSGLKEKEWREKSGNNEEDNSHS